MVTYVPLYLLIIRLTSVVLITKSCYFTLLGTTIQKRQDIDPVKVF